MKATTVDVLLRILIATCKRKQQSTFTEILYYSGTQVIELSLKMVFVLSLSLILVVALVICQSQREWIRTTI